MASGLDEELERPPRGRVTLTDLNKNWGSLEAEIKAIRVEVRGLRLKVSLGSLHLKVVGGVTIGGIALLAISRWLF